MPFIGSNDFLGANTMIGANHFLEGSSKSVVAPPPTPYDPSQTSGLYAWYDAQYGQLAMDGASNRVSGVPNRTGGPIASQTVQAQMPTYVANGINGHPSFVFDGSDDNLNADGIAGAFHDAAPYTVFIVNQVISVSGIYFVFGVGGGGSIEMYTNGTNIVFERNDTVSNYYAVGTGADTNPHTMTYYYNGTGQIMRKDGIQIGASGTSGGLPNPPNVRIGCDARNANFYYVGYVGEIIVYNRQLTSSEIGQVESYLATKWAGTNTQVQQPVVNQGTGF